MQEEIGTNMANELIIDTEAPPVLTLDHAIDDKRNLWNFEFKPMLSLINKNPDDMLLPMLPFELFNPKSLAGEIALKVGDIVNVTCNVNDPVYQAWNPSEEYDLGSDYRRMFEITSAITDIPNYPVFITRPVL